MLEILQRLDLFLFRALTPWQTPWLDTLMSWTSTAGIASAVWLALAIHRAVAPARSRRGLARDADGWALLPDGRRRVEAGDRPAAPSILATAPPRELPPMPRSLSFPSGHATASFGAAVAVSRMWPQTRLVWWALALVIGYSRIYLGHHYPLDVAGGALCGILIAFWVLGGRHPATYASTLPRPLPAGTVIRP